MIYYKNGIQGDIANDAAALLSIKYRYIYFNY